MEAPLGAKLFRPGSPVERSPALEAEAPEAKALPGPVLRAEGPGTHLCVHTHIYIYVYIYIYVVPPRYLPFPGEVKEVFRVQG